MLPRAPLVVLLGGLLAGCAAPHPASSSGETFAADADARAMDWSPGNWWAYHATLEGVTFDIALIVHHAGTDGSHLGTNLTSGFFGFPWNGNVTTSRNPVIAAEEWRLFEFPLSDGQQWTYRILGYDAKTRVRATAIELPSGATVPGHRLESTSYGRLFARYDYAQDVGWFTSLQIIEPTDGHVVLDATLTAFGTDWASAYFVERTLREISIQYPTLPGSMSVDVPGGYASIRASLLVQSATGVAAAKLRDDQDGVLASASVIGRGVDMDDAKVRTERAARWTLEHTGVGTAFVHLEITGVAAAGPLAASDPHKTRPAWPHDGQTIALPSGSGA